MISDTLPRLQYRLLFYIKNLLQKSDVLMFEYQFRHKVVGLESKFFWLLLAQHISFTALVQLEWLGAKILAFWWSVPLAQIFLL